MGIIGVYCMLFFFLSLQRFWVNRFHSILIVLSSVSCVWLFEQRRLELLGREKGLNKLVDCLMNQVQEKWSFQYFACRVKDLMEHVQFLVSWFFKQAHFCFLAMFLKLENKYIHFYEVNIIEERDNVSRRTKFRSLVKSQLLNLFNC